MDYEEKYKAALGWMQSLYGGLHGVTKEDAEKYFPELKESEDEKMRKSIIYALQNGGFYSSDKTDEAIAWLEKQGHMLDTDKVIEWFYDQACQGWIEDVEVDKFVDKFKKDFGL